MARVVIVGKTRMKSLRCIGALGTNDNRSYRLLTAEGRNFPANTAFNLGQVWDLDIEPESNLSQPHTEDARVLRQRLVRRLSPPQVKQFLLDRVTAPIVAPYQLFDRCVRFTVRKKALVFRYGRRPQYSTGFWRLENALHLRHDERGRIRYLYCQDDQSCDYVDPDLVLDVQYVGCEPSLAFLPRHTLLRFSLSREYRAGKYVGFWLQLSGWFL